MAEDSSPKENETENPVSETVTPAKEGKSGAEYSKGTEVQEQMSRRKFIPSLALGWLTFTGALATMGGALNRFLYPNVLFEPPSRFKIGFPEDFASGQVDERFKEKFAVWVVRDESSIYALSTVCTHLGCTPNWLSAEEKFKCPCHGSGFYSTGINFEGPAPRPLERFEIGLADDGQIFIDKTRKFQQEKKQWDDPASFLAV